jgi:hypothetical protein
MVRRAVAIASLLAPGAAAAHDQWLESEQFLLQPKQGAVIHQHVGDHFSSELDRPWEPQSTLRFELHSPDRTTDLLPVLPPRNRPPIAALAIDVPGTHVLVLDRKLTTIVLEAPKFNHYLEEEGFPAELALRKEKGEEGKFGRERYTRYLKSLLQVGPNPTDGATKVYGQRLELVPAVNPYRLRAGAKLPVKVLFEGRPLAKARLVAYPKPKSGPATGQQARTGEDGIAELTLREPGVVLVRVLHLRRCDRDCGDNDWESFWGSLTFEVKR